MRKLLFGASLASVASLGAARAHAAAADEATEPIRVRLEAPAGCSDDASFFDEVRSRTSRVRLANPGEPASTFVVRIENGEGASRGSLSIVDASNVGSPRTLEAPTCADLVAALAFIAALSVDPAAHVHAVLAPPPPAPPLPPSWDARASTRESVPPVPALPPAPPAPTVHPPGTSASLRDAAPRLRRPLPVVIGFGAGFTLSAPDPPASDLGGRAFVELGSASHRTVAPSARLSFDLPGSRTLAPGLGTATLNWTRGSLDGCPIRLVLGNGFSASPCVGLEVGVIEGGASGIVNPRTTTRPWVAAEAEGRLRWSFWRWLFTEVDAGLGVPFVRQEFLFLPSTAVYQAPPLYFRAMLALGVHFS